MIKDFDSIKKQLEELAPVINSFKSESVQLRIVELIFNIDSSESQSENTEQKQPIPKAKKAKVKKPNDGNLTKKTPRSPGDGPVATITKLYEEDFFKDPQTIGSIIDHCKQHMARQFKSTDLSGKLSRMTRDGQLKRTKNSESQYEYTNK